MHWYWMRTYVWGEDDEIVVVAASGGDAVMAMYVYMSTRISAVDCYCALLEYSKIHVAPCIKSLTIYHGANMAQLSMDERQKYYIVERRASSLRC
mmetsp:Transcript_3859/g.5892  ORF Transcript_3859/g.5892 Transcript_3859/m.5892 type:complete len:95 (+) Transcript_3859:38-322(+)